MEKSLPNRVSDGRKRWRPEAGKATEDPEVLSLACDDRKGRAEQASGCEVSHRVLSQESNLGKIDQEHKPIGQCG